jgi:hypothetical protein
MDCIVVIDFTMRKVSLGQSNALAGIPQVSGMSFDKLQSRQKTGAVGDLHVESRPRVELKEQRSLLLVEDEIGALIPQTGHLPAARAEDKKLCATNS